MKKILDKKYYDTNDLQKMIGLAMVTIKKHLHNGTIQGTKIGKRWYVSAAQLEAYLSRDPRKDPRKPKTKTTQRKRSRSRK